MLRNLNKDGTVQKEEAAPAPTEQERTDGGSSDQGQQNPGDGSDNDKKE